MRLSTILTFESAKIDTPPATSRVQTYSEIVYLMPYTRVPISITANDTERWIQKMFTAINAAL